MNIQFVNQRSEITALKEMLEVAGNKAYRTRLHCNCKAEFNRRDGILVTTKLGDDELVIIKVIKCKQCKSCVKGGLQ
jgi:hypothetical protein